MRNFLRTLSSHGHATKHLLLLDAHSMLVIFMGATMFQFLALSRHVEIVVLVLRGTFLLISFLIYVLSRIVQREKHHDHIVLASFAGFTIYRIFAENIAVNIPGATHGITRSYWALVTLYLCTGIRLRYLLAVTMVTFIGLVLQVLVNAKWEGWVLDLPLFSAYSTNGLALYYAFFCLATEVCRLRHHPLKAIEDLPPRFLKEMERTALTCLPTSVFGKSFSREEHFYILFRITQTPTFRDAALQLIGEDLKFTLELADTDKLERSIFRSALIQFHLQLCPNPALRQLATTMADYEVSKDQSHCTRMPSKSSESTLVRRRGEPLQKEREVEKPNGNSDKPGFKELNLFNSFGNIGSMNESSRRPLEAFASKLIVSRLSLDARLLRGNACSSTASFSIDGPLTERIKRPSTMTNPYIPRMSKMSNRSFRKLSRIADNESGGLQPKCSSNHIIRVGGLTFPVLDVSRAQAQAEQNREQRHTRTASNTPSAQFGVKMQQRRSWYCSCLRHKAVVAVEDIPPRPTRGYRNSTSRAFEIRLNSYDDLLQRSANAMTDPITVRIDNRMKLLQIPWIQRFCPCLKQLVRWLQGVEAVMETSQWQASVHIPKRGMSGRFLDIKIERWFLAWLTTVQARQYILLSPLVSFVSILVNLVTWDIMIVESYSESGTKKLATIIIYMTIRSLAQLSSVFFWGVSRVSQCGKGLNSPHQIKKRAVLVAIVGLFLTVFDTLVFQLLITKKAPAAQFVFLYASLFPLFSQLTTANTIWISFLFCLLTFSLLVIFVHGPKADLIENAIYTCAGSTIWMILLSRILLDNYRLLFCRYVFPYLMYLDALQYPSNESSNSSFSSSTDSEISSDYSYDGTIHQYNWVDS